MDAPEARFSDSGAVHPHPEVRRPDYFGRSLEGRGIVKVQLVHPSRRAWAVPQDEGFVSDAPAAILRMRELGLAARDEGLGYSDLRLASFDKLSKSPRM